MKREIWSPLLLAGILGASAPVVAYAVDQDPAITLLLQRASYWQSNGRMDLAVQNWRQTLNANPNQPQALVGLARNAATQGEMQAADAYLQRLKQVAPENPAIADIEGLLALGPNSGPKLAKASQLAADKEYAQAIAEYNGIFNGPPPPKWAQTYYQTMVQMPGGQKRAVTELTALVRNHPDEPAYRLVLGQVLTYDAATRIQGIDQLSNLANKGSGTAAHTARDAWHQALVWMGDDPAAVPYLRAYLAKYRDQALSNQLRKLQQQSASEAVQRVRGQALGNAYKTMNQGQLDEARSRFAQILDKEPNNVKALEGLGDVAFKDKQFDDAARYYVQARAFSKSREESTRLEKATKNAYFWSWMQSGSQNLASGQLQTAANAYRQALSTRPDDTLAVQGLAGTYLKMGQTRQATDLYADLTRKNPYNADAWLGYMQTLNQAGRSKEVLALSKKMPASISLKLERDPDYATVLASAESDAGQHKKALKLLQNAIVQAKPAQKTDLSIQKGWLLYKMKDDAALYELITGLMAEPDALSATQNNEVRTLYLTVAQREAQAALKQGDDGAADAILAGLNAQYPDDPGVARIQANLMVQQRKFDEAESIYRQIGPGDTAGDVKAAVGAAMANGDGDQAQRWLHDGLTHHPDNVSLKEMQATLDLHNGNASSAKKALQSALASLPQSPRVFNRSGRPGSELSRYPFASTTAVANAAPADSNTVAYPFGVRHNRSSTTNDTPMLAPEQTGVATTEVAQTRTRIQDQLDSIDAHTSSVVGGALFGRSRSGTSGLDQFSLVGTQIDGSVALGYNTRMTARLTPIRVNSGNLDTKSAKLFGTGPVYGGQAGASSSATGLGLTVGINSSDYGIMLGTSPQGFPLSSLIGQVNLHPEGSPVGFSLFRQSVTDSVLSFAGAKDPQTGQTWGGVFRNGLGMNFGVDNTDSRLFGGLKLAYLNGTHIQSNTQVEGNFGASWSVLERKNNHISVGVDALSMFYAHDSSHFSYGQGGYFSPSYYFRPAVTMNWSGQAGDRFGYRVDGFMGWQTFHRDSSPYFPVNSDLQAQSGNAYYPSGTVNGVGYGLKFNLGYAVTRNLTMGGFLATDNSQDYSNVSAGLQLRYWFSPQVIKSEKPLLQRDWYMGVDSGESSPGN